MRKPAGKLLAKQLKNDAAMVAQWRSVNRRIVRYEVNAD
jgi:hypothetical protein